MKTVKELTLGETIDIFLLIKHAECKVGSTNKKYIDLILCDHSGEMNAKIWDHTPEIEQMYKPNVIIKARGVVKEWNGQPQLNIERLRLAVATDGCRIENFVPSAPFDPEFMYDEIIKFAQKIKHDHIQAIIQRLLVDNKAKLLYYPAAQKNHHSIRAGWLYHILTMLRSGEKLCDVYTFLNTDLVFAGVILHDIAKLEEMNANELGIVSDYTIEGQLLGHIIQGIRMVDRIAKEINADAEVVLLLHHLILSHHYKGEWGSPKVPMIPEAELLHHLDVIDANMFDFKKAIEHTNVGEMSEKVWTLQRKVYRTDFS
jgi:3'-5' exoribonuclease